MGTAQLRGRKRSQGELFSTYNSLMGGDEDEVKLFSVVPIDRKRGNGYKLKHIKFYLMTRNLFTMKLIKTRTNSDVPSNSSIYKIQVTQDNWRVVGELPRNRLQSSLIRM